MPSGTPTTKAATTTVSDWARTDHLTWLRSKPIARGTASSRRRARTAAHVATPNPTAPTAANDAPTASGTELADAALITSGGRTGRR